MRVVDARLWYAQGSAVKIIDSRSGEVMTPGKTVGYGGGEKLRVIDVDVSLVSAKAFVETTYRNYAKDDPAFVTTRRWVPLVVRFLHPAHLFERVAFIPS